MNAELIYNFSVMAMAILLFFMKFTAPNAIFEVLIRAIGKVIPLFCILYAGVQIFKHFGII